MPKLASATTHPDLTLDALSGVPLYKQLYDRLRSAILSGQLERGARLPSTRSLAAELGISRSTTALAYEQLILEGYLDSRVGHGTSVARQLPELLVAPPNPLQHEAIAPSAPTAFRIRDLQEVSQPEHSGVESSVPFRGGEPALDLFPYALWARLVSRNARNSLSRFARYQPPQGYFPLREAIAAHIGITRGVRCSPDQIIITSGSQGALDLAARTLLNPGDEVWVENPGYFGAQGALRAVGARVILVPVDEQGIDVQAGQRLAPNARLVSTTPSHQFPTGVTMSLARRLALLDWAKQSNAWIVEDDYDSEYRFSGRPLEALQGLDQSGRVLYVGTFSKVMFPLLRIGYLVAPSELIEPLLTMRRFVDTHVPILEQLALTDFMVEGHFVRHLRHMRQHYIRRRNLLRRELETHLAGVIEVAAPEVGMHLVGWLAPGKDDRRASMLAAQHGLNLTPISSFSLAPLARGGLIFGYASTPEQEIPGAVRTLSFALTTL